MKFFFLALPVFMSAAECVISMPIDTRRNNARDVSRQGPKRGLDSGIRSNFDGSGRDALYGREVACHRRFRRIHVKFAGIIVRVVTTRGSCGDTPVWGHMERKSPTALEKTVFHAKTRRSPKGDMNSCFEKTTDLRVFSWFRVSRKDMRDCGEIEQKREDR